jgi:hypothetical protein
VSDVIDEFRQRRRERLARDLEYVLRTRGSVNIGVETAGDVELWRSAARLAGRRLCMPIRTGVSRDGAVVWASHGP